MTVDHRTGPIRAVGFTDGPIGTAWHRLEGEARDMRLEQLEYLNAVARCGSLRRASEHLHVSQPALSEGVSKLERELGVSLLERHRSGARISRHGRELLPRMLEVLDGADRLRAAARDPVLVSRVVRVGTTGAATSQVLVPALRTLQQSHPYATVEVVDLLQPAIEAGLQEGTLDLGLLSVLGGDDLPVDVRSSPLLQGRPVAVLPAVHPLAGAVQVSAEALRAEPFIQRRAGSLMHRFANRLFGVRVPQRRRSAETAQLAKLLVAHGLGIALLPDYGVREDPLQQAGLIVDRPIMGEDSTVRLLLLQRHGEAQPEPVDALAQALVRRSGEIVAASAAATPGRPG